MLSVSADLAQLPLEEIKGEVQQRANAIFSFLYEKYKIDSTSAYNMVTCIINDNHDIWNDYTIRSIINAKVEEGVYDTEDLQEMGTNLVELNAMKTIMDSLDDNEPSDDNVVRLTFATSDTRN